MAANYEMNKTTKRGWTKQPNAILRDKDLTSDAKVIIYALLSISGDYHISESGIASAVNLSLDRVKKAIKLLKSTGYIEVTRVMNNHRLNGYVWKISDANGTYSKCDFRELENPTTENPTTENPTDEISSDRETQRPKTRLMENLPAYEYTERFQETNHQEMNYQGQNENEERENEEDLSPFSPTYKGAVSLGSCSEANASPPSSKTPNSNGQVITQKELVVNQAFDKFCDVYPNLSDRNAAREAFLAIPDINIICWQIVQSVEWFENLKRWDDWRTGQKNVSCPQAVKFLKRGDWQEYMKASSTKSRREELDEILPDEEDEYETN